MTNGVPVFFDTFLVGKIHVARDEGLSFEYAPDWLATSQPFP